MICIAYIILRITFLTIITILFFDICHEDNAAGKIRNNKLILGFKYTFTAAGTVLFLSVITYAITYVLKNVSYGTCKFNLSSEYLKMFFGFPSRFANSVELFGISQYIIHLFISFLISFGTWKIKMWPAGDAKLFLLASSTLPVILPNPSFYPLTLSLSLVQNIIIPAAVVFILQSFFDILRKIIGFRIKKDATSIIDYIKKIIAKKITISGITEKTGFVFTFIVFFYMRKVIRASLPTDTAVFFIIMFIVWKPIGMFLRNNKTIVFFLISIFIATALMIGDISKLALAGVYGTVACIPFLILRSFIMWMMKNDSIRNISINEIKAGTVLTENYLSIIKKTNPEFFEQTFKNVYPDGLTEEQSEKLKLLLSSCDTSNLKEVQTHASKPFSSWITAGLAMTILLNGETVITLCKFIYQTIKYHL